MKKTQIILLALLLLSVFSQAQKSFDVIKTGAGQPILLLPGFACTSDVFEELSKELAISHEVHAFTFAGFGDVPPIDFPWLPQIKTGIEKYIQQNDLNNTIIIGHSLGGTLGLWLAAESQTFSKLIIIDALPAIGALMIPEYDSETIVYDSPYSKQIWEMDEETFRKMANQSGEFMTKNLSKQQTLSDWIVASDRKTYIHGYTDLLKLDLRKSLEHIRTPVYILAATEPYGIESVEITYREQYKNLLDYNIKFAEGSGHFIMYDKPEWLMKEIHTALKHNE